MALANSLITKHLSIPHKVEEIFTLHFTSFRKMMSVLVRDKSKNENYLLIKGAAERVVNNCTSYLDSDGKVIPMTDEIK